MQLFFLSQGGKAAMLKDPPVQPSPKGDSCGEAQGLGVYGWSGSPPAVAVWPQANQRVPEAEVWALLPVAPPSTAI